MAKGVKMTVRWQPTQEILKKQGLEKGGAVQKAVDEGVLKQTKPYIPRGTGKLYKSGIQNTVLGSGKVVWDTEYARLAYYRPMKGNKKQNSLWFERMKQDKSNVEKIVKAAADVAGVRYKV